MTALIMEFCGGLEKDLGWNFGVEKPLGLQSLASCSVGAWKTGVAERYRQRRPGLGGSKGKFEASIFVPWAEGGATQRSLYHCVCSNCRDSAFRNPGIGAGCGGEEKSCRVYFHSIQQDSATQCYICHIQH